MTQKVRLLEWCASLLVMLCHLVLVFWVGDLAFSLIGGGTLMIFPCFFAALLVLFLPTLIHHEVQFRQWRKSDHSSPFPKKRFLGLFTLYHRLAQPARHFGLPMRNHPRFWKFSLIWLALWSAIVVIGPSLLGPA